MKRGFGLIQVLIVLIVMAGILALSMRYLRLNVKHTTDSYAREEAELFLRNSTELAVFTIGGYPRIANNNCLSTITINSPVDASGQSKYSANINIATYYLLNGSSDFTICNNSSVGNYNVVAISSEESHGLVMLEVVVTSNTAHPKVNNQVRLVRRTLQRI